VKAFTRAIHNSTLSLTFTRYSLKRVIVLDNLLKKIKRHLILEPTTTSTERDHVRRRYGSRREHENARDFLELSWVMPLMEGIDNAEGLTPFRDQLESEQRWPLPHSDTHDIVPPTQSEISEHTDTWDDTIDVAKSAIVAYILHTLLSTRDVAVWLKAQMKIAKQNENDHLLSRAVEWNLADTVELLLVSGADPRNHGIGNLDPIHGTTGMLNSEEIHFSVVAHLFLKLLSMRHYWSFREDDPWARPPMVRARHLRKDVGPFSPDDIQKPSLTWIHVRRNNVS
jgi:hypothetical protein